MGLVRQAASDSNTTGDRVYIDGKSLVAYSVTSPFKALNGSLRPCGEREFDVGNALYIFLCPCDSMAHD